MPGPPSRSSFPSIPGEPRVRRLGVGSSSTGDRPLRAQIVVALVGAAMLIAVPLYLMRHPNGKPSQASVSAAASAGSAPVQALSPPASPALPAPGTPRLTLGPAQKVRCGASANARGDGGLCDSLAPLEEALKQAIKDSEDCAPRAKEAGSINFVLTVDFTSKKLHVFPGASGSWRGKLARRTTSCVSRAVKAPDWAALSHQHRFYSIAVLATYAAPNSATPAASPSAGRAPGAALPNFE